MFSVLNISNRKPALLIIVFGLFVISTLLVFLSRQDEFLKTINNLKKEEHSSLKHVPAGSLHQAGGSSSGSGFSGRRLTRYTDKVDDSGAKEYLTTYRQKFGPTPGRGTVQLADPNKPHTIRNWWEAAAMIDWYINTPLRYNCKNIVAYGNWHACQDAPYRVKPPCLVYSFGINYDFSFDDAMGKLGCEVHSFDPSMKGITDHKRNANVTFHELGLGSINTDGFVAREDMYVKGRKVWKLRTVRRIKEMLGHQGRVIDVFKMDIEGYEWHVLDNMMETEMFPYIRQYMLEFHLFSKSPLQEDYVNCYNIYRRLRELGMREYHIGPHMKTLKLDSFNNQGDSEFVNANFRY